LAESVGQTGDAAGRVVHFLERANRSDKMVPVVRLKERALRASVAVERIVPNALSDADRAWWRHGLNCIEASCSAIGI